MTTIKPPTRKQVAYERAFKKLRAELGYSPTVKQMAEALGISEGSARGLANGLVARGRARRGWHTPYSYELVKKGATA